MSQTTPLSRARPLLLTGLLLIGGCFDSCDGDGSYDPTPGPGELGNGDFHYHCISDDDPACTTGTTVANFPARVAVGGRFELTYTWNKTSSPTPDLRSAAPERLAVSGDTFTARAEGYTAVIAVHGNSDIGDLIHIRASAPAEVAVQVGRVDYTVYNLAAGAEVRMQAITRDDDDYVLAGLLNFEFSVDDPAVVDIVGSTAGHATLRGVAAGSTVLHTRLGDLVADVVITVAGSDTTGDPTDGTDSDTAGTTADTDDSTSTTSTTDDSTSTTDDTTDSDSTGSSSTGGAT